MGMVVEVDPEIVKEVNHNLRIEQLLKLRIYLCFFKDVWIDGMLSKIRWCRNTKIGVKYLKLNLI